jgi:hypothetical protein
MTITKERRIKIKAENSIRSTVSVTALRDRLLLPHARAHVLALNVAEEEERNAVVYVKRVDKLKRVAFMRVLLQMLAITAPSCS